VVANNLMALGTLQAAHELGVRIGRDLALITIDDPPWTQFLDPPLTAVAQPIGAMACEALELLVARIDGDQSPPRRSVHPLTLIERGSSGPLRAPRRNRRRGA
jgi:LacI family transcriptional regulator